MREDKFTTCLPLTDFLQSIYLRGFTAGNKVLCFCLMFKRMKTSKSAQLS